MLKKTLNAHRDKWDYVVVFTPGGWHIIPNDRIVAKPITSIAKLKPKKGANKTQVIHSFPLNKTALVLPNGTRVGGIVPKSDNWMAFEIVEIVNKKLVVGKFKGDKKLYDIQLQIRI